MKADSLLSANRDLPRLGLDRADSILVLLATVHT